MEYVNMGELVEDVVYKLDRNYGNLKKDDLISFSQLLEDYAVIVMRYEQLKNKIKEEEKNNERL